MQRTKEIERDCKQWINTAGRVLEEHAADVVKSSSSWGQCWFAAMERAWCLIDELEDLGCSTLHLEARFAKVVEKRDSL